MSKKRVSATGLSIPSGVKHFTPSSHRDSEEEVDTTPTPVIPEETQKETYMIPKKLVEEMEDVGIEIKRKMKKGKVTKTSIVISALKLILKEYREKGSDSQLSYEYLR